ncbi:MAG: Mur ligase family protein [Bacteroidota bacterium]
MSLNQLKKVHFIAIGGSVMHNLAIELKRHGIQVSGSDDKIFDPAKSELEKHDLLPKEIGWNPENISENIDCVILGMHAREDNPELAEAKKLGLQIYSFPEFVYQQSKNKQRIVIAGSHGKTTITAMILHVLRHWEKSFDFVAGARLNGFDTSVHLSEAPVIIIEGDEYLSSSIDRVPKFLKYNHHIALLSGIAWDHINVFPSFEEYVSQFEKLADATPKAGALIFSEEDNLVSIICNKERADVSRIEYKAHQAKVENGTTLLIDGHNEIPIKIFGKHNLQNLSGAKAILKRLGIKDHQFYEAIRSFSGAKNRMELIKSTNGLKVYKDYAHSPSKVKATSEAVKAQFLNKKVVACLELHTFSSLNKSFLKQYQDALSAPDIAMVFFNPANFESKKLEAFGEEEIKSSFARKDLPVVSTVSELEERIKELDLSNSVLIFMSSGDFAGLNIDGLAESISN